MKKLFGELNLTWPKVIIFAIIAGVYTGIVAQIPQARDTSFADISITFEWTLLTIPMGYIGYWLKKDKWWGLFIIVPMMIFLGYHYMGFLRECWTYFPHHLLSAIFCVVVINLFGLYIFKDKKIRKIALIIKRSTYNIKPEDSDEWRY